MKLRRTLQMAWSLLIAIVHPFHYKRNPILSWWLFWLSRLQSARPPSYFMMTPTVTTVRRATAPSTTINLLTCASRHLSVRRCRPSTLLTATSTHDHLRCLLPLQSIRINRWWKEFDQWKEKNEVELKQEAMFEQLYVVIPMSIFELRIQIK